MQLSQKTKDKDLKEFFSVVGDVRSVKMIQDRHSRRSKAIGIAYIEFKYSQSVPLALGLNGQQVNGIPIIVQQSQAEKNRHAQMVESAKQTLSKLGNGPIKLKVRRFWDFESWFVEIGYESDWWNYGRNVQDDLWAFWKAWFGGTYWWFVKMIFEWFLGQFKTKSFFGKIIFWPKPYFDQIQFLTIFFDLNIILAKWYCP
jgi:hypothetical protein